MFNYTISDVLDSVKGVDTPDIIDARSMVEKRMNQDVGTMWEQYLFTKYKYKNICPNDEQRTYEWKKIQHVSLAGNLAIKSGGKSFKELNAAQDAALNESDANGITFSKKTGLYTLRFGDKIIEDDLADSWVKIPVT